MNMRKLLFFILMLMSTMVYAEDFSVNGILYHILSYQDLTLAVAPVERGSTPYSGDIIIPSSVTYGNKTWTVIEIMDDAFGYNSNITSVTLPSTLKKIGKNAFYSCSNSLPIAIPDGVEYIGGYAFCGVKISGTLPKSLRELGDWAFSGATMESIVIPKHLKKILAMTFASIENAPVTFNDSLELIETNAFYQNKTFVNLVIPASVKSIGSAFQQCTNIETVQLPEGLLEFGSYHSLPKLYSINIPDSITRFQPSALANCPLIKDVHWPKFLSTIEGSAFKNTGLKIVRFPDKLYTKYYPTNRWGEITGPLEIKDNGKVSIGSNAFADCLSLDSVYITDVVSSISNGAFGGKTKLKAVVTTKEKPMSINQDVFSADTYLSATLYVPYNTSEEYKKATAWSNFSTIIELPKTTFTLVYIVDGEIYKTYEIKQNEEIIPEPAPTKEGYSFSGWSGLPETMPGHDVTVTGTFTINKYKLTYMVDDEVYKTYDVEYGATITPEAEPMKEGYTFSGWSEIPETMPAHDVLVKGSFTQSNSSVEIDGIYYNLNQEEKSAEVVGGGSEYSGIYSGDIVIPSSINYEGISYSVTSIGVSAFQYCSVKSVTIPNSVTKICDQAFYNSESIETIDMSENVQSIGYAAFCGLEKLKELKIPRSVNSIGNAAFCRCKSISSFVIPEGVTSIGTNTFYRCEQLESVVIPTTIKTIEGSAFRECYQLFNMVFPEGLESIGGYAFYMCKQLAKISLPNSIKSIGGHAFANCDDLTEVTSNIENPFEIENVVFECYNKATLFIPKGTREKYENTNPWKRFSSIVEMKGPSYKLSYFVDGNEYKSYEIEYGEIITPEPEPTKEGYTFSGWSEIPETMPDHDVTVTGTFEAITHTLSITASGNGSATYRSTTVKGKTQTFTVTEGTTATITFVPDVGYRIASVKLDNTDVTSSVVNNQYTISNIKANTSLEVTFEAIPTYALNITSSGNGSATFNGTTVKGKTQTFTVIEGTSATVTFAPDAGYRIASVKLNNTDVTASVANNSYTISNVTSNTTLSVTFEVIPPTTYAFTISAVGNGYVAFDGNTIRSKTFSFNVVNGTNAVLTFSADEGNRLKSVKVNGQDVTSSIVGNQYTITNISANTTIAVVFEAIPTYALNIVASGNGSASYDGVIIRNQSQNFTLREGASTVISFSADNGYRIASVKVNNADVTSQIVDGKITVNSITQNTNVEVVFEEIPPTVYALSITASGNGTVIYDGHSVKDKTSTFTIIEGSYVTVQLLADDGYRLKSMTLNGQDVTEDVVNNQYTTPKIMADAALVVVFEAIPTFTLTIKSSAFGAVKFGDVVVSNRTETFSVREGTSATMTFTPDDNGRLHSIMLNGTDITKELVNGQYTISNIRADQSVEAEFVEDITKVTDAGIAYTVTSYDEQTVIVAAGNYGNVLIVPASFTAKEKTWTVVGIDEDALKDNTTLAAIVWNPEVAFTAKVSNPNLLLYVKDAQYAPATIQNVVVNNQAENIVLVEAASGNDFYCPQTFTAKRISYEHNYSMISGYKTCQGWETLVLPFDVTMMINAKGQELTPYINWQYGNSLRPFWLYEMTTQGWKAGSAIKANTPYIISMPNNEMYDVSFNQTGNIQFIGTNVEVKASTEMKTGQHGNKRLVANYQTQEPSADIYALNVSNEWSQNTATEAEGSTFIRSLRSVHPFEAYLTVEGSNAPLAIPVFENLPTGINEKLIMNGEKFASATDWYTIDGRKLQDEPKQNGIYIIKGKKVRK